MRRRLLGDPVTVLLRSDETCPTASPSGPAPVAVGTDHVALLHLGLYVRPETISKTSRDLKRLAGNMIELQDQHIRLATIDARVRA